MKKIIFCDNSLWGLLNFRREILIHFLNMGYDVVLVAPDRLIDNKINLPDNIKYIPIKLNGTGKNPFTDFLYFVSLLLIYFKEKPDYIFHYTIKPNIYGSFACNLLNIRSTAMIPGLGFIFKSKGLSNVIVEKMLKNSMKFASSVLVLNQSNYDVLLNRQIVCEDKMILLRGGEGINLDDFPFSLMPKNTKPVFLMICRMLYEKGFQEFINVASTLKDKACFRLMGPIDNHPSAVCRDVIEGYVNEGIIEYIEFTPNVKEQIIQSDCIVLPSFYGEGLSRVLMEGLAIGRPIITTKIPGCQETVIEGVNGFLCEPHNTESLKIAVVNFLNMSTDKRAAFGQNSRNLAEKKFDIKSVVKIYNNIVYNNF